MSALTTALAANPVPTNAWVLGETSGTNAAALAGAQAGTYAGGYTLGLRGGICRDTARATHFDGINARVTLGANTNFPYTGAASAGSVEAWIRLDVDAPNVEMRIVDKSAGATREGWNLSIASKRVLFQLWQANAANSCWPSQELAGRVWYHVVATFDATDIRVYIDGVLGATTARTVNVQTSTAVPTIGYSSGLTTYPFHGEIQYVALYDTKIDITAVGAHYDAGSVVTGTTYYVSPTGSDAAAGGSSTPWATLWKVGETVQAGDTVIWRDGTYTEVISGGVSRVRASEVLANSGTKRSPITLRAENALGAIFSWQGVSDAWHGFVMLTTSYVIWDGFTITKDAFGTNNGDVCCRSWFTGYGADADLGAQPYDSADFCEFKNLRILNHYEPIKNSHGHDMHVHDCTIEGPNVAIGAVNGSAPRIHDNYVLFNRTTANSQLCGIEVKGGTRSARVYNNVVRVTVGADPIINALSTGGGSTPTGGLYDTSATGYESFRSAVYNNVVVGDARGLIVFGIIAQGSDTPLITGNVIINADAGFRIQKGGPMIVIGPDYPKTNNPTIENNILWNVTSSGTYDILYETNAATDLSGTLTYDYNLHYNVANPQVTQAHPRSGDPLFAAPLTDWRIGPASPALNTGTTVTLTGFYAETVPVNLDKTGATRTVVWSIGAYETASDTTAPVISAVGSSALTGTTATITWTTDEVSDTQVEYGLTVGYGSSSTLVATPVTSHSQGLTGLTAGTLYHYRVLSRDSSGNLAASADNTFSTTGGDVTAPVISSVAAGTFTGSTVTITWSTNEASDSQVEYGPTIAYGTSTTLDATMVASHSVLLTGLSLSTLYHYRVKSKDAAANLATSADFTFTTTTPDSTPPVISAVTATSITGSGATITWTTNELSDSQVEYGLTTAYGTSTILNTTLLTSHSQAVTGLTAGTLYHYRVKSRDSYGNLGTSADSTFSTTGAVVTVMRFGVYAFEVLWNPGGAPTAYDTIPAPNGPEHVVIVRGRQNDLTQVRQGRATISVVDAEGVYNPNNASSPLVIAGQLKVMRRIRVTLTPTGGAASVLFTGYLTRITHNPSWGDKRTTFEAVDGFEVLDRATPVIASTGAIRAGYAINLVLNQAGIIAAIDKDLDLGDWLPDFSADGSDSALALIDAIWQIDRGMFFVAGNGKFTYRDRSSLYGRRSSAATLTAALVDPVAPAQDVYNIVNYQTVTALPGGVAQSVGDNLSIADYFQRTGSAISSAYLRDSTQAASLASWIVSIRKSPDIAARTLHAPGMTAAQIVQQAARDLADPVTLSGLGPATSARIEGLRHEIDRDQHQTDYTVTLRTGTAFTIGVSVIGGTDVLAY